jgi:hypothetical protein
VIGYTADQFPLSAGAADQVTYDTAEAMDACPECGESFGYSRRGHKCPPERDRP